MENGFWFVCMGVACTAGVIVSQKTFRALQAWWMAAAVLQHLKPASVRNAAIVGALLGVLPAAILNLNVAQGALAGAAGMAGMMFSLLLQSAAKAYRADAKAWKRAVTWALTRIDAVH